MCDRTRAAAATREARSAVSAGAAAAAAGLDASAATVRRDRRNAIVWCDVCAGVARWRAATARRSRSDKARTDEDVASERRAVPRPRNDGGPAAAEEKNLKNARAPDRKRVRTRTSCTRKLSEAPEASLFALVASSTRRTDRYPRAPRTHTSNRNVTTRAEAARAVRRRRGVSPGARASRSRRGRSRARSVVARSLDPIRLEELINPPTDASSSLPPSIPPPSSAVVSPPSPIPLSLSLSSAGGAVRARRRTRRPAVRRGDRKTRHGERCQVRRRRARAHAPGLR